MSMEIELDNIKDINDVLFKSEYRYLIFNDVIKLYENRNSTLLELLSYTDIAGIKNEKETVINVDKISYIDITVASTLTKVLFWFIAIIGFLFTSLTILVEYSQDIDSFTELIFVYILTLLLYSIFYFPLAAIAYYYVSREYLVLYSDNGNKIKINIKKVTNYSELNSLLKKLL
jgi:hypothetical protein